MAPPKKHVVEALITGQLRASTTIISDSLVQPALLLFRELIEATLGRGEAVCLVCCEIDANRFVESLCPDENDDKLARLQVLDCNLDYDTDTPRQRNRPYAAQGFDVEGVAELSKMLSELDISEHATIFFDSVNALETFNSLHAVLRMFRNCKYPVIAVHHTDVPTSPNVGALSRESPLLSSLLTASGSRSSIHLTLHPCALLAHLHYVYGIENVGQSAPYRSSILLEDKDEDEVDVRVYQFLNLLHHRGWGSPMGLGDAENDVEQFDTERDEDAYGGREYDSPSSSRVIMDMLGCSSKTHGSGAARCIVEHALRGVNKSNKRSDASKIVRGLEGLVRNVNWDRRNSDGQRALHVTRIGDVVRIKSRGVKGVKKQREEDKTGTNDPFSTSMFNLGLTDRQREEKERVELPFARGGGEANGSGAIIIYEPDSADDLDDSDPDEDLEI